MAGNFSCTQTKHILFMNHVICCQIEFQFFSRVHVCRILRHMHVVCVNFQLQIGEQWVASAHLLNPLDVYPPELGGGAKPFCCRDLLLRKVSTISNKPKPELGKSESSQPSQLPAGWHAAEDASTGATYYYSDKGETTWDLSSISSQGGGGTYKRVL